MSAAEHQARGTYRADRHGPLPAGMQPMRPALASVPKAPAAPASLGQPLKFLDADDCPDVLAADGKAFWLTLITTRPPEKIFGQLLATYVEAWQQWKRWTVAIHGTGDLMKLRNRPVPNPYLAVRANAEKTMLETAKLLNWTTSVARADIRTDAGPTKLEQFLAAKRHRR